MRAYPSRLRPPDVGDDLSTLEIEAKAHELKAAPRHLVDQAALVLATIEHEETAAARAHDLAAERARAPCRLVVLVERRAGNVLGQLALVLPVGVEQLAESVDVAALEQSLDLVADLLDAVHGLDLGARLAGQVLRLLAQDLGRAPLDAGVEDEQIRFQIGQRLLGHVQR